MSDEVVLVSEQDIDRLQEIARSAAARLDSLREERDAARSRIAELTGALDKIREWPGAHWSIREIARAALARPSTGGGATPPAASTCGNLYENAETIRARGQRTLTVEDIQALATPADHGRLDPVEAALAVECPNAANHMGGEQGKPCFDSMVGPAIVCLDRIRRAAIPAMRAGVDPATVEMCAREADERLRHWRQVCEPWVKGEIPVDLYQMGCRAEAATLATRIRALSQGTATPKWRAEHVDGFGALMTRATPPEAKGTGMEPGQRCTQGIGDHEPGPHTFSLYADIGWKKIDNPGRCCFVEPSPTKDGGKP